MAESIGQLARSAAEVHAAIDQFEQDIAEGRLTFTEGEFADEPTDKVGGWVGQNVTAHVALMDVAAGGAR